MPISGQLIGKKTISIKLKGTLIMSSAKLNKENQNYNKIARKCKHKYNQLPDEILKKTHTRIPNDVFDIVLSLGLNGTEANTIFCIFRETYGYGHSAADLSLTFIAKKINRTVPAVSKAIMKLIETGLISIDLDFDIEHSKPRRISLNLENSSSPTLMPDGKICEHKPAIIGDFFDGVLLTEIENERESDLLTGVNTPYKQEFIINKKNINKKNSSSSNSKNEFCFSSLPLNFDFNLFFSGSRLLVKEGFRELLNSEIPEIERIKDSDFKVAFVEIDKWLIENSQAKKIDDEFLLRSIGRNNIIKNRLKELSSPPQNRKSKDHRPKAILEIFKSSYFHLYQEEFQLTEGSGSYIQVRACKELLNYYLKKYPGCDSEEEINNYFHDFFDACLFNAYDYEDNKINPSYIRYNLHSFITRIRDNAA